MNNFRSPIPNPRLRVSFMGTPDFVVCALEALAQSGHEVVCVYTQPPRPKGRGQELKNTAVHQSAERLGIAVRTPLSLKNPDDIKEFQALELDAAVVAGYGMMLPQAVLDAPRLGCLNIHPSLLPRWRGTSPIQSAIWAGDETTGVCIIRLVQQMDAGPILARKTIPIEQTTTATELNSKLWPMGAALVVEVLDAYSKCLVFPEEIQDEEESTYGGKLTKDHGQINWTQGAVQIDRQIRALNPWPGVFSSVNGKRFKITQSAVTAERADDLMEAGKILNKQGDILCGNGSVLRLVKIQPEGKAAMDFASALNGNYIKIGERFS